MKLKLSEKTVQVHLINWTTLVFAVEYFSSHLNLHMGHFFGTGICGTLLCSSLVCNVEKLGLANQI